MEEIIQFDKQLLLMVNGSDSLYLDYLILTLTNALTWIPLYASLLYVVIKTNLNVREVFLILLAAGLCVLLAGTVDDEIVKPLVARWRPTHDPQIGSLVDVVNGYRGGNYGFFSAHAANTFSLAVFFSLLMRQRLLTIFLVGWSLINCYTRLYLGVHYPGDITVGLLWGGFVGWFVYWLYCRVTIPARYAISNCYVPVGVLCLTIAAAAVCAAFGVHM
jgi:undecaprenyl-diphosphatase